MPADVPKVDSIQSPMLSSSFNLASLLDRKLSMCDRSRPEIPKSFLILLSKCLLLTLPKASVKSKKTAPALFPCSITFLISSTSDSTV